MTRKELLDTINKELHRCIKQRNKLDAEKKLLNNGRMLGLAWAWDKVLELEK
jgi:hypothetical protein